MQDKLEIDPYDEAEILAAHLSTFREEGLFDSIETVGIRGRLGELVLTGKITETNYRALF